MRVTMLRRIPSLFLKCLNLFEECDTLARRGRYVMLRITLFFLFVLKKHTNKKPATV